MSTLLYLWFAFAPPEASYEEDVASFDSAFAQLGAEGADVADSVSALEQALEALTRHPDQLPNDAAVQERIAEARLGLVWQYLEEGDEAAAAAMMDDAIRSARGRSLPAGTFGPDVLRLYEARSRALEAEGTAIIEADCGAIRCQLLVDERRSPNPTDPLLLGTYRVWVGAREGEPRWEYFEVELEEAGSTVPVVYQAGLEATEAKTSTTEIVQEPPPGDTDQTGRSDTSKRKRMLPRWVSILGMTVGAGLAVGGGLLLIPDGACINGADPSVGAEGCPTVWSNKAPAGVAYGLLGAGGGVLLISGVILTVDEVRVGRATGRQAMLNWGFRF